MTAAIGAVGLAAAGTVPALAAGGSAGLTYNVVDAGIASDGRDVTSALQSLMNTANAAATANNTRAVIYFPAGTYGIQNNVFAVPERLSLQGESRQGSIIRNLGTLGGGLVSILGSGISVRSLTFDGQRASQSVQNLGGGTVVFAKPTGQTGNSQSIAGGLLLSAPAAAGATSIQVSSPMMRNVPVLAGDAISLSSDGVATEVVRVADGYAGGTTLPLTAPLTSSYSQSAYVAVFSTDNVIADCVVRAVAFVGIEIWHAFGCRVEGNVVRDFVDTGIDAAAQGTRNCAIVGNDIESNGKWGIFIDSGDTPFTCGYSREVLIADNQVRFLPGGTSYECIGTSSTGPTETVTIVNNLLDLTLAGHAGIRLQTDLSRNCIMAFNTILCGGRTASPAVTGIARYGASPVTTSMIDVAPQVIGNTILGAGIGIDLYDVITATVVDNHIICVGSSSGISIASHNLTQQRIRILGNEITGCTVGVITVGNPATQSPILEIFGNHIQASYLAIGVTPSGKPTWTVRTDDDPAARPDTSGATLSGLETEVNALKAAARRYGVFDGPLVGQA